MRSGTTALQSLICSTPQTNPLIPECDFLIELVMLYRRNRDAFAGAKLPPYFGNLAALEAYMQETTRRFLDVARLQYRPATTLAIKNPELTPYLPEFFKLCPSSRLVVSIRDPRDTIASIVDVATRLAEQGQKLYVVGEGRDIANAAGYFNAIYQPLFAAAEQSREFAEALLFVRYEDLCLRSEEVVDAVQRHCGIDLSHYDPGQDWRRAMGVDQSAWSTRLWGKGVSPDSIGRFRSVLTNEEVAHIEEACSAVMSRFGYTG